MIVIEIIKNLNPAFIMIIGLIIGGVLATIFDNIWLTPLGFGIGIIATMITLYFTYYKIPQQKIGDVKE